MAEDPSCLEPHVSIIQPTSDGTGPILCVDNNKIQYFVPRPSIQPIVHIHTTSNQSVYRGVLKKEIKEDLLHNKQNYYFVYTARHEGLNLAEGVHVTFEENNARKINCTNIVDVGRTTSKLELDNNNCEAINDFLSVYGDAISSNIPIDVLYDSTSNTKQGRLEKKRDPMKRDDLCIIISNYIYLVERIEVQHVQSFLLQECILDRNDIHRLKEASKSSREEATMTLLDIVMYKSGSDVFPTFVKCLFDAGYELLASKLQPTLYPMISKTLFNSVSIH